MKNFKQLREKIVQSDLSEKKNLKYSMKDLKSAEFIKNEMSSLVKAEFKLNKVGTKYELEIIPKTDQDEKIVRSFMDDARIEMLKDEFIRSLHRSSSSGEEMIVNTMEEEQVSITPTISQKIREIHDTLNRDNQEIFMEMLVHSRETFNQVVNFCETFAKK